MCRNSHNCACTVAHHNIVGNVNRNLLAVNGVDSRKTVYLNACLVLDKLCSLKLGLFGAFFSVACNLVHIGNAIGILINHRMLGSHNHECNAEKSIGTSSINLELLVIRTFNVEINESTRRLAYPVSLLKLYVREIVNLIKSFKEFVGILCYTKIPNIL